MAAKLFKDLLDAAIRNGVAGNSRASFEWYRREASKLSQKDPNKIMRESKAEMVNQILPGHMYMFLYDPKHKNTLPYYDKFPLIFPFRKVPGGFLGLNLHYLHPRQRAMLMEALYALERESDAGKKLQLSYRILASSAKYKWFGPCVKHYLNSHVRSRFIMVDPEHWPIAAMLPTQQFVGASKEKVWNDSANRI